MNRHAVIYENPSFEKIKGLDRSIVEISDDPRDYVELNAEAMENGASKAEKSAPSTDGRTQTACQPGDDRTG
ncbi:hypothetical protein [Paraburkholderia sp. JHI869]|uniref:hypothetical protein n=1 Tax=Paraburkholderia sp. JHI869 TaxID=3112959 RepID=UPI00316C79E8